MRADLQNELNQKRTRDVRKQVTQALLDQIQTDLPESVVEMETKAIVYQIVQAHEGKVWARSEVGKGTSFVLRLRRMDRSEEQEPMSGTKISAQVGLERATTSMGAESKSIEAAIASLGGTKRG